MAFVYPADQDEIEMARAAFGEHVAEVVFYDPEFPEDDEPWVAVAYDADGNQIGTASDNDVPRPEIMDVPGERDETVKFWLKVSWNG